MSHRITKARKDVKVRIQIFVIIQSSLKQVSKSQTLGLI